MTRITVKMFLPSICSCIAIALGSVGCADQPDPAPPGDEATRETTDQAPGEATDQASLTVKPLRSNGFSPCSGVSSANNGLYCGSSQQAGFGGGPSNALFTCVNQQTVDGVFCGSSCTIAPAGVPDHCNPDPCAHVTSAHNGKYCGRSAENSFDFNDASFFAVYTCSGGHTVATAFCSRGCTVAAAGTDDFCN